MVDALQALRTNGHQARAPQLTIIVTTGTTLGQEEERSLQDQPVTVHPRSVLQMHHLPQVGEDTTESSTLKVSILVTKPLTLTLS